MKELRFWQDFWILNFRNSFGFYWYSRLLLLLLWFLAVQEVLEWLFLLVRFPIVFGSGPNAVWLILIGIILAVLSIVFF